MSEIEGRVKYLPEEEKRENFHMKEEEIEAGEEATEEHERRIEEQSEEELESHDADRPKK